MSVSKKEVSLSAYKALERKVLKLEEKNEKLVEKLKIVRCECRGLRKAIKRISISRDKWKLDCIETRSVCKSLTKKCLRYKEKLKPKGHQYSTWLITLTVILRISCNCSYGSIKKVLTLLQRDYLVRGNNDLRVPCEKTLQNWVSKVGFYYLQNTDNEHFSGELCLIIDESIRVGTEKLLLILACPMDKVDSGNISSEDVRVVGLEGSTSWKGVEIATVINRIITEKELDVKYILSDEGNNLVNAAKLLELPHLADISHLVATCLKKTFEDRADYKAFSTAVNKCQAKLARGKYCYLRPPKQRVKARFLNQEKVVNWAITIFDKWTQLEKVPKEKLALMQPHKKIVGELSTCIKYAKVISKSLKINGLNLVNIKELITNIKEQISETKVKHKVQCTFLKYLKTYLEKYETFLKRKEFEGKTLHTCSDIIERLFGIYKAKVSDNYFVTTTTIGLELPLMCLSREELSNIIQPALEATSMTDLKEWRSNQNSDNQSLMRLEFFKK
jgi:hypothetical protein